MMDDELDKVLAALPRPSPAPGFADRVMARVAIGEPVRAHQPARIARRPSLTMAVSLAVVAIGSIAATITWTLSHHAAVVAFGQWVTAALGEWTWDELRDLNVTLARSLGLAFLRELAVRPLYLAIGSVLISLVYSGGVFALRRLMIVPTARVAHVEG